MTVFGHRVLKEGIKLKQDNWSGLPSDMTAVLLRKGNLDTDTHGEDLVKMQGEDGNLQSRREASEETSQS